MDNETNVQIPTNQSEKPKKNPLGIGITIFSIIAAGLIGAVIATYILVAPNTTNNSSAALTYTVDTGVDAITAGAGDDDDANAPQVLTLIDLSDSFTDKYLTIDEWNLNIKTKYADLLEYEYIDDPGTTGETAYAECNGDYLVCDSVVAVRIREQYVDMNADEAIDKDTRTVAYIYQDNRSLSKSGSTIVRYWDSDAFTTEYGTRGTLLFEAAKEGGEDELGFGLCGVDLNVDLGSEQPCEDIFMSLYRFDASTSE